MRHTGRIVPLGENPTRSAAGDNAFPGDNEPAVRRHGHSGIPLIIRGRRIDVEFPALLDPGSVITLAVNAVGAVLIVAVPDDDETPVGGHARVGPLLGIRCVGVDEELASLGRTGGIEALGIDAGISPTVILLPTRPRDHEPPIRGHGDGGTVLVLPGRCVDEKLGALLDAAGVISLGIDAIVTRLRRVILALAFPGDHESPVGPHDHVGISLIVVCIGIGPEFASLGCTGSVEALAVDPARTAVLVTGCIDGHVPSVRSG